jgi:DNA-binding transcriptional ArsR family regulator
MNNKLNAISTFLRVAEAGSFSAAARQTGIKQSAVSQQIAALEEELGVVLLHRTTRTMKLTEQGERYRRDMQLVLDAMGKRRGVYILSIIAFRDASMSSCRAAWGRSFCRICWRYSACIPNCS